MKELKYPMVECDAHPGEREPGYIVCKHVLEGAPIAHLFRATADSLGVISCQACDENQDPEQAMENFVVSCARGMREKGFLASA